MTVCKNVVTTGATSGLGFEALKELVGRSEPYFVIIAARSAPDSPRDQSIIAELEALKGSPDTSFIIISFDASSFTAAEEFTREVKDKISSQPTNSSIDILLLCAGIVSSKRESVKLPNNNVEVEKTLAVNTLNQAFLVTRLFPLFSKNGRISLVSSKLHERAAKNTSVTPETIGMELDTRNWKGMKAYDISKLVQIHLSLIIKDKSDASGGPSVVSLHPGFVPNTNILRDWSWPARIVFQYVLPWMPFATSLQTGGTTIVRSMTDMSIPSGSYISKNGIDKPAVQCEDVELRQRWAQWLKELGVWES